MVEDNKNKAEVMWLRMFVCLSTKYLKKLLMNFNEILRRVVYGPEKS